MLSQSREFAGVLLPAGVFPHDGHEARLLASGHKRIASFVSPERVPDAVQELCKRGGYCQLVTTVMVGVQSAISASRRRIRTATITVVGRDLARAQALFVLLQDVYTRSIAVTEQVERQIGELHDYTPEEIDRFLSWRAQLQQSL